MGSEKEVIRDKKGNKMTIKEIKKRVLPGSGMVTKELWEGGNKIPWDLCLDPSGQGSGSSCPRD